MTFEILFWTIGPICCYIFSPWKPPKKISHPNTPFFREALEVPLGRANDPPRHALEEMNGYRISQLTDVCWFWKKHVKLAKLRCSVYPVYFSVSSQKKRRNVHLESIQIIYNLFKHLSWGPTFDGMLVSCIIQTWRDLLHIQKVRM